MKCSKKNDYNAQGKNKRNDGDDGNDTEKEHMTKRQRGGNQRNNKKQGIGK